jgi:beta-phosphoglucomutase-like phosphatase (HAD superfamily)
MGVQAVVFDLGGTLVDETRIWQLWADWLSVPRLTFLEALRGTIVRQEHHRSLFERLRPADLRLDNLKELPARIGEL